jgi:hypothetical protein
MNSNLKKILLIFGGGYIIYWAFTKLRPIEGKATVKASSSNASTSEASFAGGDSQKKNAMMVLRAYRMAKKNGESKEFLNDLNVETAKEFGMKVMTEKSSGKCFVVDLNGNKIA